MKEEWKKVPGLEMEVTRTGRIRTPAYSITAKNRWGDVRERRYKQRELSPHTSDNGYARVQVQRGKMRGPYYMHRLIALAFVSGYKPGLHVNHINGIKADNRPENLEWVLPSDNIKLAWKNGLVSVRHTLKGRKRAFRSWAELFARATKF
jgi:hypothetical protein